MLSRRLLVNYAIGSAALGTIFKAAGQVIQKPVKIVAGFPAGGALDTSARFLATSIKGAYADNIVVENRPGAGGRVANDIVKAADADGSVLLVAPDLVFTIYPHIYKKLSYELARDFIPVSPICAIDYSITVGPAVPEQVRTLSEYAQWAKQDPKRLQFGSPVAGGTPHFLGVMLARELNLPLQYIAYKGGVPMAQDLLGGHLPMAVQAFPETVEFVKAGKLRSLAITSASRSRALPDVQTMTEAGFKTLSVSDIFGVYVPARTSIDIVQKLAALIQTASQQPDYQDFFVRRTFRPVAMGPAEYAAQLRQQANGWEKIVVASGFKTEE